MNKKIHIRHCMLYEFDRDSKAAEATKNIQSLLSTIAAIEWSSISKVTGFGESKSRYPST